MKQKRIKLMKMFQLITVAAVVLLAIIIVIVHILSNVSDFEKRAETMRVDYLAQQKTMIKREVQRAVAMINEARLSIESETKKLVKQRVYEAWAVAENIYQVNKESKSKPEIEKMIVDALRGVRFADGSGYYFITGLDGVEILFADKPELEGVNLLNIQDPNGKYVVRNMIEVANSSGEGFCGYHWTKPKVTGVNHEKIAYIKLFKPLGWFIGTGLYVEDIEVQIQVDLLASISKIRFGDNGYVFVNKLNGDALVANGNIITGSKKLWQVFAKNPDKTKALFDQEYVAAKKVAGDFIYYSLGKLTEPGKEFPKVSYIHGVPELQWLVGAGVYIDTIESDIALLQFALTQQKHSEVKQIVLITAIIIGFVLFIFHLFSNRLQKDYSLFVKFFDQAAHEDKEIECDKIYFEGLAQIAASANIMLLDKKKVLENIRVSEEKYRNIFDNAMVGLFRSRLSDGLYLEVNEKAAAMLGCKIEDVVGKIKTADLYKDSSQRTTLLAELEKNGYVDDFEIDLINPDGREVYYSISVKVYPDAGYMEGIAVDITDRKRAEALLTESEERFRNMADLLPQPIFESNLEMAVTYANVQAFELFGFSVEDLDKGLFATDLFTPKDMPRVVENTSAQFLGQKKVHTEYTCRRIDGSTFPALFHVSPMVKNGKPCGLRGVIVDLTERKQAEEEILKLRKLESVGVLAGGIAHDFNNLLAGLFGNLEMAKRFLPVDHKSFKYLESAGMSMERATGLTRQLLTFAKGGDPIKETLSLEVVIAETAQFSLRGSNVKLQLDIDPKLWLVDADKGQLSQVVSNLVINAKQAMPDGGVIMIAAVNSESSTAKQIKITVKDQGVGIAPQHLNKIFDPYFSTKQQGSGLGLASCYSIIAKHGGTIGVESELNHGTTFTIVLPVADDQAQKQPVAVGKDSSVGTHLVARILILDDEELVQVMSSNMLAEMGHRVECASDGAQAIEKYRLALAENDGYDIVVCDLTIPGGMGGQEAAQKIIQLNPQANLIVSSGYATDPIMANYSEYGFKGQVAKPYSFAVLQQAVQRVLEA